MLRAFMSEMFDRLPDDFPPDPADAHALQPLLQARYVVVVGLAGDWLVGGVGLGNARPLAGDDGVHHHLVKSHGQLELFGSPKGDQHIVKVSDDPALVVAL